MNNSTLIPTVDLSPFFKQGSDEDGKKKKAKLEIKKACSEYGFFLAVNHEVPLELMRQALQSSKSFFDLPDEQKLEYNVKPGASPPEGYYLSPGDSSSHDKREHFFRVPPNSHHNKCPPALFQQVLEDMNDNLTEFGLLVESIINDCLGLPRDFLKEYNNDRSSDFLVAHHYFSAQEITENVGKSCHTDWSVITFVFTDGVKGLQVYKDGIWIPINPPEGALVVNVGDILQVMSNGKFKSPVHRVVSPIGQNRYSYAFYYNIHGDKLVQPLPHLTINKGVSPKYRGFLYKDYVQSRLGTRTNPETPEEFVGLKDYAIPKS